MAPRDGLARYVAWQDGVSVFVGKAVSWLCLAMIGVLLYEITARYIFLAPTEWAHESTTMLYGTFCVLAGVYTHRYLGHVRSEAVYQLFPRRAQAGMDVVTGVIGLVFFGVFFFVSLDFALDSWAMRETSSKSTWAPPIYPFKSVLPIAIALIWLQSIAHLIRDVCLMLGIRPDLHPED